MSLSRKAILLALRLCLGAAILMTFASILGVGVARQAALGGGFSEETRSALTENALLAWLRTGGWFLLATGVFAGLERWLSGRWGGA
ncbi:hypothetical protein [Pseudooceanicola sp. LIPI14-2-Ac024]|uniref:hypothetical protein n=1 Tax=Pseudooceanicola sp. LIPI14-2-Ac024 TaxID=3344875 RepID=UPI0035CF26CA